MFIRIFFIGLTLTSVLQRTTVASTTKPLIKTIVIMPAGSKHDTGRRLQNSYERGIAHQCAKSLRDLIEDSFGWQVLISHEPQEAFDELQAPSLINRLNADLVVRLHVHHMPIPKPFVDLFYLTYNPLVDLAQRPFRPCACIPLEQAHFSAVKTSLSLSWRIYEALTKGESTKYCMAHPPLGIPLRPLRGFLAPAIAFDIGICEDDRVKGVIAPLAYALHTSLAS